MPLDEHEASEAEIIADAVALSEAPCYPQNIAAACETIWSHGFADDSWGSITEAPFVHKYRVARWIVTTEVQGSSAIEAFNTETEAISEFPS